MMRKIQAPAGVVDAAALMKVSFQADRVRDMLAYLMDARNAEERHFTLDALADQLGQLLDATERLVSGPLSEDLVGYGLRAKLDEAVGQTLRAEHLWAVAGLLALFCDMAFAEPTFGVMLGASDDVEDDPIPAQIRGAVRGYA